jgi:NADH:ubiquinone oxidoreductase subunit 2 (subunit N)
VPGSGRHAKASSEMWWLATGIVIASVITLNAYLIWANKRRAEHDTIQREADEQ